MMRRRFGLFLGFFAIVAGTGLYTSLRTTARYDLKIKSRLPLGVQFEPVSRATTSPIFDVNLFGKQFVYPQPGLIIGFKDPDHTTAGFLCSLNRTYSSFSEGTWQDEKGVIHWTNRDAERGVDKYKYLPIPTAFGDKPRELVFHWNDNGVGDIPPFRIVLPPNGIPAPKVESATFTLGGVTVRLVPEPPIAPGFRISYRATLSGGSPGANYRIAIGQSSEALTSIIRLQTGESGLVTLSKAPGDRFDVELDRLSSDLIPLTARRVFWKERGIYQVEFVDRAGERRAYADEEIGPKWLFRRSLISSFGTFSLEIGNSWFEERLEPQADPYYDREVVVPAMKSIKTGQRFVGKEWNVMESHNSTIKIPIPDLTYRVP